MIVESIKWNKETYLDFMNYLYTQQDIKYREFHKKLIRDQIPLIGIRTPLLKKIARKIAKNCPEDFLKVVCHNTYEECVIHGLVLGYMETNFITCVSLLNQFFPFNTNWAINDITCANLKIWQKNLSQGFKIIEGYLQDSNPWIQRFGLVLLLDFYINDNYIDQILELAKKMSGNMYYVGMANAWLLSVCYIKYPEKTEKLLDNSILDSFTLRHTIQKILESNRVSEDKKEIVRKLREQIG